MAPVEPREGTRPAAFRRAFFVAYGLGAVLCVVWPLVLQVLVGRVLQPGFLGKADVAEDLGYTFTGLVVLSALYVMQRSRKARARFAAVDASRRSRMMALEILLYSSLFACSTLFGLLHLGLGGAPTVRHARTFMALSTVMFLVFVPRSAAWRQAMEAGDRE